MGHKVFREVKTFNSILKIKPLIRFSVSIFFGGGLLLQARSHLIASVAQFPTAS